MVDIGAGTTGIAVLEYRQGVFHQIAAASGDGHVMGRDPSDMLVCTDSERVVSFGATEHGFHQGRASQSLECGRGVTVFDRDAARHRHLLLVPPGRILPPEGLFVERDHLEIGVMNGGSTLVCKPFVCRSGVRATVVAGRDTFLEDTEIIRLQEVQADRDDVSQGTTTVPRGAKSMVQRPRKESHDEWPENDDSGP